MRLSFFFTVRWLTIKKFSGHNVPTHVGFHWILANFGWLMSDDPVLFAALTATALLFLVLSLKAPCKLVTVLSFSISAIHAEVGDLALYSLYTLIFWYCWCGDHTERVYSTSGWTKVLYAWTFTHSGYCLRFLLTKPGDLIFDCSKS